MPPVEPITYPNFQPSSIPEALPTESYPVIVDNDSSIHMESLSTIPIVYPTAYPQQTTIPPYRGGLKKTIAEEDGVGASTVPPRMSPATELIHLNIERDVWNDDTIEPQSLHKTETPEHVKLTELTLDNTPNFSDMFTDTIYECKCVKVYDGDTITVALSTGGEYFKYPVRMNGYDTPEIRTRDLTEKSWGYKSKYLLSSLILNRVITLKCHKFEKYGRILGTVLRDGIDVNEVMIKRGYARAYDGGKKMKWDFTRFTQPDYNSTHVDQSML
jgi:endonuclease YncB( thermonuclease family)